MSEVQLKNISKIYPGNVLAVDDFNLTIEDGEFVVLVGPSGCGKSTTLRMVAGLEEITGGTIAIGDRIVNDVHPKDRDIAMVFQNYALYPHMTVYKNMAFALKLRKMPRPQINQKVRATAAVLGIEDLLERKPKALSGGQRQRVALGRAIVREPKAFLFDEPLSNLDAKLRIEMRAELKSLHMRLKTTTLYVTHDQEEAMTLGDRVVVMSQGIVQQVGTPLDIYRQPVNRFVAGFLGMPPMNFVEGTVQDRPEGPSFVESKGDDIWPLPAALRAKAAGLAGRPMILGLRPEAISMVNGSGSGIELTIEVVEPLGDRMDLYLRSAGGTRLVARLDARSGIRSGEKARFVADSDRLHLFEPGEFGKAIRLS